MRIRVIDDERTLAGFIEQSPQADGDSGYWTKRLAEAALRRGRRWLSRLGFDRRLRDGQLATIATKSRL